MTSRTMDYQPLGHTGLLVSRLCLGTMTFGDNGGIFKAIAGVDQKGLGTREIRVRESDMTTTIKRIATRWTLPALMLIAGGFVCDGLTEIGHHALLIAGGVALGVGIGKESR